MKKTQIVITGADSQLGQTFKKNWPTFSHAKQHELVCCGINQIDITSRASIDSKLSSKNVGVIINSHVI